MLGFASKSEHKPDFVAGSVVIARQRNELAGERARDLIKELLEESDRMNGVRNGARNF